jgi:hypothetical protein
VIDENVPHHLRSDAEKVRPVFPLGRLFARQAQVCFVNQGAALEGVIGAFVAQVVTGDAAQLTVNERNELFPRILVTLPPVDEQLGDSRGRC